MRPGVEPWGAGGVKRGMAHLAVPVSDKDHAAGPADAPATLVEYGDFQCPDCGEAEPILREVRRRMGDRLRFVFRNFPLTDVHPYALGAAEAAEAAGEQGRFWAMHDLLLENQEALAPEDLEGYAQGLGLDVERFREALRSHAKQAGILETVREGEASGVRGTPTLYLNGARYDGAFDAASIIRAAGA